MKPKNIVLVEALRELLALDPDLGTFTWAPRAMKWFQETAGRSAEHSANNWNARYAGKQALCDLHIKGYLTGRVLGVPCLAHRVVWAMHFGAWPELGIDHINGCKTDNRIANLRTADHIVNARNMKRMTTNKTGITGVSFDSERGKFYASIRFDGKTKSLGRFDRIEEAAAARIAANERCGFHKNHGRA